MTNARGRRGKFDTGACFLCMEPESPDFPLLESRWGLYRIWLCEHHTQVVEERMREQGKSRDRVLEDMMDSVLDWLGPALGLNIKTSGRERRPKSEAEAEEIALAEQMDQEDQDDLEWMTRASANDKCSVCGSLGDRTELHEREVNGTTVHVCGRDEKAILELVEQGCSWTEAKNKVGADLFQALVDPEVTKRLREHIRRQNGE